MQQRWNIICPKHPSHINPQIKEIIAKVKSTGTRLTRYALHSSCKPINKQDQLNFVTGFQETMNVSSKLLTELFFWSVVRSLFELPRIHDKNDHATEDAFVSDSNVS